MTNSKNLNHSERQRFVNSIPEACSVPIDFYIYHLLPMFIENIAPNFDCDRMSGAYSFPTSNEDVELYCTPYWETDEEVIEVATCDEYGNDVRTLKVPFLKKDLTFHPRNDAKRFVELVTAAATVLGLKLRLK